MSLLENFSNPTIVSQKAKKIYGNNVEIKPSTRKDKKYMIRNPSTNKYIHFGQLGYEDYTKHQDEKRRENYLKRNAIYKDADRYTAGYMAYHLLW